MDANSNMPANPAQEEPVASLRLVLARLGELNRDDEAGIRIVLANVIDALANPAQVTDAQIEHMVQQFLGWRLPETFGPDAGIRFERVANAGTPYEFRHEPVGTNLFDYTEAKAMVQHMLEGLPAAIGAGGQAVAWPEERANIPDPHNPGARIVGFRIREGDEAWGESGLSEPLFWLEKKCRATLSQLHPADERVVEALDEELLGRLEFGATNIGANLEAGECLVILAALSAKEGL